MNSGIAASLFLDACRARPLRGGFYAPPAMWKPTLAPSHPPTKRCRSFWGWLRASSMTAAPRGEFWIPVQGDEGELSARMGSRCAMRPATSWLFLRRQLAHSFLGGSCSGGNFYHANYRCAADACVRARARMAGVWGGMIRNQSKISIIAINLCFPSLCKQFLSCINFQPPLERPIKTDLSECC